MEVQYDSVDVSVVVISYNPGVYAARAIDSVVSQEFDGTFEILIFDDGSTDGSIDSFRSFVNRYEGRASLTVMERDAGASYIGSARVSEMIKLALAAARGRYLCFLSADDYFLAEDKLQIQVDMLERAEYRDCSFCASSFMMVYEDGSKPVEHSLFGDIVRFEIEDYWSATVYTHISSCLFRNRPELLDRAIDLGLTFIDDTGFLYLAGQYGLAVFAPFPTFAYRQHVGSIMAESSADELEFIELMLMAEVLKINPKSFAAYAHQPHIYVNRILRHAAFPKDVAVKYAALLGSSAYGKLSWDAEGAAFLSGPHWPNFLVKIVRWYRVHRFNSASARS